MFQITESLKQERKETGQEEATKDDKGEPDKKKEGRSCGQGQGETSGSRGNC